jgi:predicted dienelactone hydrolase
MTSLMGRLRLRGLRTGFAVCAGLLLAGAAQPQVGMSQLDLPGLPVTLVYPTEQASRRVSRGPFELDVAINAAPSVGLKRLVLLSHGSGGSALADHSLAATLARAGFVVAQPLHAGDNHRDRSGIGPASWARRPAEASRVIDALAVHPQWQSFLRLDKVGVHGMSAGGVTALSMAGARWRLLELVRHCRVHADQDPGFCQFGLLDPGAQAERRGDIERAADAPESQLPAALTLEHGGRLSTPTGGDPRPDTRIAAVSLAVPVAAIFSAQSLAQIQIPVAVVSAGRDTLLLPRFHSQHVLDACKRCVPLVHLAGAGHFDLLSPWPAALAEGVAAMQPRGGKLEAGFDAALRQAAFEQIAAFYKRVLLP